MDEDILIEARKLLERITVSKIRSNEKHIQYRLIARGCTRHEIIRMLLSPHLLVKTTKVLGDHGDIKYELWFLMEDGTYALIPVIFDNQQGLYVLTFIKRYRK